MEKKIFKIKFSHSLNKDSRLSLNANQENKHLSILTEV